MSPSESEDSKSFNVGGDVLFVGAVSTSVIGYEVRDSLLVEQLASKGASFSLAATVTAPFSKVQESFSVGGGPSASASASSGVSSRTCDSTPIDFRVLEEKRRTTGRLRFQRAIFVPVLLETVAPDALNEAEWKDDRQRDVNSELGKLDGVEEGVQGQEDVGDQQEEQEEEVGYLSLATHLTILLHLPGAGPSDPGIPIGTKHVRIRSLAHHAENDLCSIVRVVVTGPTLEAALASDNPAPADGIAALCLSVMLRVISLGHTIGAMVDADQQLQQLLGGQQASITAPPGKYRLLNRCRTPYGAVPLSELFHLYRIFCEQSYYRRPIQRHGAVLAQHIWTCTPILRAAEASFPHRWNAMTEWGTCLDAKLLGEPHVTPLVLTLSHCTNLRRIRLLSNRISDATCFRLCALFSNHRYLTHVFLQGNDIYESGADAVLRWVRRNHRIVELDLSDNPCSDFIRRRIQKVVLHNEAILRQDPLHFMSSQYSYLVSPASLPKTVLREAMVVWAQLTAVPVGDIDIWPRNSTTEDMDHYVDESILPRLRDTMALADAPHSIIPLAARAPLLSELMRTVSVAIQRVVPDPLVRSIFTDVTQMEGRTHQHHSDEDAEDKASKIVGTQGTAVDAAAASPATEEEAGLKEACEEVPPEVWTALQLKDESKQVGPVMEVDELYSISFLRIIVTTLRTLEHQFDWEEVVDKLRKVGQRQVELGVRMEDYWLAMHVFMRSLQLTLEGSSENHNLLKPEAVSAILATLALGFRTALSGATGLDQ